MFRRVAFVAVVTFGLGFSSLSCGGSSPTSGGTVSPPPTTAPPATTPPPPVTNTECPLGKGTADTSCYRATATFLGQVDQAIELLAREQPQIFNLNDQKGSGGYLVKDTQAYYAGVVKNLQDTGMCAGFDYTYLNVKNSNTFSEQFDILLSDGHARRGSGSYQGSCYPANFPVDAIDVISYVRVAFFGFKCDDGVAPPPNADRKLPIGCVGFVTATPKDKDGHDVDPRIHGDDIVWKLEEGKGVVDTHHVDGQPFNWNLEPKREGEFSFCATLQGIKGCLNGTVIPNPTS
jgi:hypothetical protein